MASEFRIPLMRSAFACEDETRKALSDFILRTPRFSMDRECLAFEEEFAAYQGRRRAVLFNSGSSANLALLQALKNLGILKAGAKVGFTAVTWATNVMPIIQLGMTPVPIDCDPCTLNVGSAQLLQRLTDPRLDAFFATDVLGLLGDMPEIRRLCEERGILLFEDNCESLGSEMAGVKAGNFGLAATFSFYIAHHMTTIEGGMVATDDEELANMLRMVRVNGWDRNLSAAAKEAIRGKHGLRSDLDASFAFYDLGYNLRPTEITGFLGRDQLRYLPASVLARQKNFLEVQKAVSWNPELIPLRHEHQSVVSSFSMPVICRSAEGRERLSSKLKEAGIEHRPVIAGNIQRQPFYTKYVDQTYPLPGADQIHDCGLYFGNYPELTPEDIALMVGCLAS